MDFIVGYPKGPKEYLANICSWKDYYEKLPQHEFEFKRNVLCE